MKKNQSSSRLNTLGVSVGWAWPSSKLAGGFLRASTRRLATAIGLAAFAGIAAVAFAPVHSPKTEAGPTIRENLEASANQASHVHRAALWPQLRSNLRAFGDRLERPGQERLTLAGTLSRAGDPQPLPFVAILQFPDRLRMTMQTGAQTRVITFNGSASQGFGGPPDSREQDLIETLVYDTCEHFFAAQAQGTTATRFLGDHFRMDDGAQPNYSGPFYDVYQALDEINISVTSRQQTKLYWFNSGSLLLERVTYQNQSHLPVEIRIGGWQQIQGQQAPTRIVRLENNQPVVALSVSSTSLGPALADGSFGQ